MGYIPIFGMEAWYDRDKNLSVLTERFSCEMVLDYATNMLQIIDFHSMWKVLFLLLVFSNKHFRESTKQYIDSEFASFPFGERKLRE